MVNNSLDISIDTLKEQTVLMMEGFRGCKKSSRR